MASDLYIAFGADTGEMEAGLAAVRATAAEDVCVRWLPR